MLIVRQKGGVVMNLDNISCIEVNRICPVDLTARIQRNFREETLGKDKSFFSFYLGTFSSNERTKEVLNELVDAYECGAKVFRVPDE